MPSQWQRGGKYTTRYSTGGTPFQVWEPHVPRIPDAYQSCAIYLYPSVPFAEKGERMGGSGFILSIPAKTIPNAKHLFAVSNAHVIESGSCTVRLNTSDGKTDVFDFTEQNWLKHPNGDDVAITRMPALGPKYHYASLDIDMLLTQRQAQELNLGPGDEVFMAGRFINSEGKQRNIPAVRFGNISQMPFEPIDQDRVWGKHPQESYLVEGRTISGFSGSPVFTALMKLYSRQGGTWPADPPLAGKDVIALLGVVWGYIRNWEPICDQNGKPLPNGLQVSVNTGMMGVVPSWKLREILEMKEIKEHNDKVEEEHHKKHGPPKSGLSVASKAEQAEEEASHRERFNRLKVAAVKQPKSSD